MSRFNPEKAVIDGATLTSVCLSVNLRTHHICLLQSNSDIRSIPFSPPSLFVRKSNIAHRTILRKGGHLRKLV